MKKQSVTDTLTHFDRHGQAWMVDVADKSETRRLARAEGIISMQASTLQRIIAGNTKKGDVLGIARVAGIQAAKQTSTLIPLCHPLALTKVQVDFVIDRRRRSVRCITTAETVGRTGVEMEALTAASVALLTIYDMCKAIDRGMRIESLGLEEKRGGKSGVWIKRPKT